MKGSLTLTLIHRIVEDLKRILPIFERFNAVGGEVYVIRKYEGASDLSKQRRLDEATIILDSAYEVLESLPFLDCRHYDGDLVLLTLFSRVAAHDVVKNKTHLQSEPVAKDVVDKYRSIEEKMRKELRKISLDNNIWYVKS